MKQGWLQRGLFSVSDSKVIVSSPGTSRWFPGISGDCRERPWQAGGLWLRPTTSVGPGRGRDGPASPCCLSRVPTLPLQNLPPLCHVLVRTASRTVRVHSKIYTCPPPPKEIYYSGRKLFCQEEIHILSTEVSLFLLILKFQK